MGLVSSDNTEPEVTSGVLDVVVEQDPHSTFTLHCSTAGPDPSAGTHSRELRLTPGACTWALKTERAKWMDCRARQIPQL